MNLKPQINHEINQGRTIRQANERDIVSERSLKEHGFISKLSEIAKTGKMASRRSRVAILEVLE